jgi:hypothetical protein
MAVLPKVDIGHALLVESPFSREHNADAREEMPIVTSWAYSDSGVAITLVNHP